MRIIPNKRQWKSWSLPSKVTFVGTVIGILGILLSIILFFLSSLPDKETVDKQLKGILSSAVSTTQSLRRQIQQLKEMAELMQHNSVQVDSAYLPGELKDDLLLQQLATDGLLFGRLSSPLQKRLPTFLYSRRVFITALNPDKPDINQLGTLWLLLLELKTQEACLLLEQRFLKGEINASKHEKLFGNVLDQQAMEILRNAQTPEK